MLSILNNTCHVRGHLQIYATSMAACLHQQYVLRNLGSPKSYMIKENEGFLENALSAADFTEGLNQLKH